MPYNFFVFTYIYFLLFFLKKVLTMSFFDRLLFVYTIIYTCVNGATDDVNNICEAHVTHLKSDGEEHNSILKDNCGECCCSHHSKQVIFFWVRRANCDISERRFERSIVDLTIPFEYLVSIPSTIWLTAV